MAGELIAEPAEKLRLVFIKPMIGQNRPSGASGPPARKRQFQIRNADRRQDDVGRRAFEQMGKTFGCQRVTTWQYDQPHVVAEKTQILFGMEIDNKGHFVAAGGET